MKLWTRALELADKTPASRNRYVDLLRAVSIGAVVLGHWLIAAPWMDGDHIRLDHMLAISPWTRWLTWLFQVMPIFFMVGGYSNAMSWDAARRAGRGYADWVGSRLRRLIGPVVPLLVAWASIGAVAHLSGVPPEVIRVGSQAALVPVWFLAVYVLVVLIAPVLYGAWLRFGMASFWALVLLAVLVDALRFGAGLVWPAWINYLLIWSAVHHMGFMWRDGRLAGPGRSLPWAVAGFAGLGVLVWGLGYPLSMVGVPGEEVSNTLPPSLAMLALGCAQAGLLLALEGPGRRWLARRRAWAATIAVNGMIMSVYLWHLTAMVLLIGLLRLLGGFGLHLVPGTGTWWATRPLWLATLAAALLVFLALFSRFERVAERGEGRTLPPWRPFVGAALVCVALALAALDGIGGAGPLGIRVWLIVLVLAGAALVRALPEKGTFRFLR